jgi:hypothetical protein
MKKFNTLLLSILISLMFSFNAFAEHQPVSGGGWALIGADIILISASVWMIIDQNTGAANYNTLQNEIDKTTEANYWRLLYEREKVIEKNTLVIAAVSVAGAALLYTAADFLWFKNAFPVEVKTAYTPAGAEFMLALNREF